MRDAARAFVHGLENFEQMKGEAYNVGLSDSNLSKAELCETIKTHIPDFFGKLAFTDHQRNDPNKSPGDSGESLRSGPLRNQAQKG